eukprot:1418437-Ditylum_brightwellii.AAC.1
MQQRCAVDLLSKDIVSTGDNESLFMDGKLKITSIQNEKANTVNVLAPSPSPASVSLSDDNSTKTSEQRIDHHRQSRSSLTSIYPCPTAHSCAKSFLSKCDSASAESDMKPLYTQIGFGIDHDGSATSASIRAIHDAIERGRASASMSRHGIKEGEEV